MLVYVRIEWSMCYCFETKKKKLRFKNTASIREDYMNCKVKCQIECIPVLVFFWHCTIILKCKLMSCIEINKNK